MSQAEICVPQCFTPFDPLEDGLMTFQVCLVGSDGIIVGSDRRVAYRTVDAGKFYWQFMAGTKFVTCEDESVICAGAGTPEAATIARAIVDRARPYEDSILRWAGALTEIADLTLRNSSGSGEVLVIRKHVPDVILISFANGVSGAVQIEQRICTGVPAASRFLAQHFWKPETIESLKKLALITLDYAAKERPTEIGEGFDLLLIKAGEDRPTWERYAPDDNRLNTLREGFQATVNSWFSSSAL